EQSARLLHAATDAFVHCGGTPLQAVEIGEHQLGLDGLDVTDRIDRALDMHDVVVFEAAHDMGDRVDFAEMTEKLVAEPLAFRGAAHQPGDIDEFELGRDDLRRFREPGAHRQTLNGYRDAPDLRLP